VWLRSAAGGGAGGRGSHWTSRGRTLSVTNLDKVLYPATGFRKRELLDYYRAVAPALLPHLRDRALHLGRWPDGVDHPGWLQANCRGPAWMRTHTVTGKRGQILRFGVIDDLPSLLGAAQMGTIELHHPRASSRGASGPRWPHTADERFAYWTSTLSCAERATSTFNINGNNSRIDNLLEYLARDRPDVVCLQELKATDAQFPGKALEDAGYHAVGRPAAVERCGHPVARRIASDAQKPASEGHLKTSQS
jgi:hypothetical protein